MTDRLLMMTLHRAKLETTKPKWYYSEILGEKYHYLDDGGTIKFKSGVTYTMNERALLAKKSHETKQAIHNIKKLFKGAVVQ